MEFVKSFGKFTLKVAAAYLVIRIVDRKFGLFSQVESAVAGVTG